MLHFLTDEKGVKVATLQCNAHSMRLRFHSQVENPVCVLDFAQVDAKWARAVGNVFRDNSTQRIRPRLWALEEPGVYKVGVLFHVPTMLDRSVTLFLSESSSHVREGLSHLLLGKEFLWSVWGAVSEEEYRLLLKRKDDVPILCLSPEKQQMIAFAKILAEPVDMEDEDFRQNLLRALKCRELA